MATREPIVGERITADWARELVREIRRNRPIAGVGVKSQTGPNGTILSAETATGQSGGSSFDGPMEIVSIGSYVEQEAGGDDDYTTRHAFTFKHPFYQVGGRTFMLDDLEDDGTVSLVVADGDDFIALVHDSGSNVHELRSYRSFAALTAAQETNPSLYILPLYMIEASKVVCDFRKMVNIQMTEVG